MNNNTQIETVEDAANKYVEAKEDRCRAYGMVYAAFVNGANWQKQQDEAEIKRLNASYEDSLSKAKYKELLDSSVDIIQNLMQYGNIRPIERVIYTDGSHKEYLDKAATFLNKYRKL